MTRGEVIMSRLGRRSRRQVAEPGATCETRETKVRIFISGTVMRSWAPAIETRKQRQWLTCGIVDYATAALDVSAALERACRRAEGETHVEGARRVSFVLTWLQCSGALTIASAHSRMLVPGCPCNALSCDKARHCWHVWY